ncbi:hypothetical protein ACWD4O_42170 [Streptomyces sp. NPDC002623]
MVPTINVAVLLAVIIVVRLRRRTQARSRNAEKLTVVIVLVFGVSVLRAEIEIVLGDLGWMLTCSARCTCLAVVGVAA